MKTRNTVTSRALRRVQPEQRLALGEKRMVARKGGKVLELRHVDGRPKSITADLAALFADMPPQGSRVKVNLSRIIVEDRE